MGGVILLMRAGVAPNPRQEFGCDYGADGNPINVAAYYERRDRLERIELERPKAAAELTKQLQTYWGSKLVVEPNEVIPEGYCCGRNTRCCGKKDPNTWEKNFRWTVT